MALHFSSLLTPPNIQKIAQKFGYAKPEYLEKFIMDFEMQYQITQRSDCILRGGMCVPFHTKKHSTNRLSIDIDLLTRDTINQTKAVMASINSDIDELDIKEIKPKNKYPIPNLISYRVHYESIFGNPDWIKVDYMCKMNVDVFTKTIPPNYQLFAFTLDYKTKILTRGSLIADKLTTLSLGTIGLVDRKFAEIPKQIFDIGSQLRLATKEDILEIFTVFEKFTNFKIKVFEHPSPLIINDIIKAIEESLQSFFHYDSTAVLLSHDEENRLGNFLGSYLGRPYTYKKTEHLGNIFFILFLIKKINEILNSGIDRDSAATSIFQAVQQLDKYKSMSGSEIKNKSRELLSRPLPEIMHPIKKMLRGQPLEYIYLLEQIYARSD